MSALGKAAVSNDGEPQTCALAITPHMHVMAMGYVDTGGGFHAMSCVSAQSV